MQKYTTKAITRLTGGQIELSERQASDRAACLRKVGDAVYEIMKPIEFKIGETFSYSDDIPRSLADCLIAEPATEVLAVVIEGDLEPTPVLGVDAPTQGEPTVVLGVESPGTDAPNKARGKAKKG